MEKSYIINKVQDDIVWTESDWNKIASIEIDNFPWDNNGYRPRTEVKMVYSNSFLKIHFKSFEKEIKTVYSNVNDPVYEDSCVEFFFSPILSKEKNYMNFEINAIGTYLIGFGPYNGDRIRITNEDINTFSINTSVTEESVKNYEEDFWTITITLPFTFIEKYFGKLNFHSGYKFKGNFYKCGDKTKFSHYGCWNLINNDVPNFHLPDFFGTLVLE